MRPDECVRTRPDAPNGRVRTHKSESARAFAPPREPRCVPLHHRTTRSLVRRLRTVSEAGRAQSDASGLVRTHKMDAAGRVRPPVRFQARKSKIVSFHMRNALQFHELSSRSVNFQKKRLKRVRLNFTNFRRNLPVFKKGVRFNFTNFHEISSEMVSFQNKECAPISPIFVENCSFSNKEFRQKWSNFK